MQACGVLIWARCGRVRVYIGQRFDLRDGLIFGWNLGSRDSGSWEDDESDEA